MLKLVVTAVAECKFSKSIDALCTEVKEWLSQTQGPKAAEFLGRLQRKYSVIVIG
jgi:hypothetical protein